MKPFTCLALLASLFLAPVMNGDVHLVLDEDRVLPGTPTGLTVIVSNPDLTPLQLPPELWLIATAQSGEAFRVSAYNVSDSASISIAPAQRTVSPGETREFRFDPSPVLAGSPWFTDGRLSEPGRYRLQAVFAPQVAPSARFDTSAALVSSERVLTVAVDSAEDAAVWEWMKGKNGGRWGQNEWLLHPEAFSDFVWNKHRESGYSLYAVIFLPVAYHDQKNRLFAEQAARFPGKSYADQLKLRIAHSHREAADILRRSDPIAAAAEAETARQLASDLALRSKSSTVRAEAQSLLTTTPGRESFLKQAH